MNISRNKKQNKKEENINEQNLNKTQIVNINKESSSIIKMTGKNEYNLTESNSIDYSSKTKSMNNNNNTNINTNIVFYY